MKLARGTAWFATLALATLACGLAGRLWRRAHEPLSMRATTGERLDEAARARLSARADDVLLSYVVSPDAELPARWRRSAERVRALIEDYAAAAPDRVRAQVVHPGDRDALEPLLEHFGLRSFRARSVRRDGWVERERWSSLHVAAGRAPSLVLEGLGPEHEALVPHWLAAAIDGGDRVRKARVGLVAPPKRFERVAAALAARPDVELRTAEHPGELAGRVDLLLWLDASATDADELTRLEAQLDGDRTLVLALAPGGEPRVGEPGDDRVEGGPLEGRGREGETREEGPREHATSEGPDALTVWLASLGVRRDATILSDPRNAGSPERIACIAPQQDFRAFSGQPNGTLCFERARALDVDPARLGQLGARVDVLATSSADSTRARFDSPRRTASPPTGDSRTRTESAARTDSPPEAEPPAPDGSRSPAAPSRDAIEPAPRRALALRWRARSALSGSLFVLASSTPFADGDFEAQEFAHEELLDVLAEDASTPSRCLAIDAWAATARPPIRPSAGAALAWRAATSWLPPLTLVLLLALRRRARSNTARAAGAARTRRPGSSSARRLAWYAALAGLVLVVARLTPRVALDWTDDRLHALPADALARLAARIAAAPGEREPSTGSREADPSASRTAANEGRGGDALTTPRDDAITLEFVRAPDPTLPPSWRAGVRRFRTELAAFAKAPSIRWRERILDASDEAVRAEGRRVLESRIATGATTRSYRFLCGLDVRRGARERRLDFERPEALELAPLRLVQAIDALCGRPPARVAFAAGRPALSPAEVRLEYEARGLFAPGHGDVFGAARRALTEAGFDVERVDPDRPRELRPDETLVWMAPRRDVGPLLTLASDHLARGGRALIAAQHFELRDEGTLDEQGRSRYWPRPLYPDVGARYLERIGVALERSLYFDETEGGGGERGTGEESTPAATVLRARPTDEAPRGLGELRLVTPSAWRVDAERLAASGFEAREWSRGGEHVFTYDWEGGRLPAELFEGRVAAAGLDGVRVDRDAPLFALELRGRFPRWRPTENGADTFEFADDRASGRLVLVGASRAWRDTELASATDGRERALVALVTELALGPDAGEWLRPPSARGLEPTAERERLVWRFVVLGAAPLALLLARAWSSPRRRRAHSTSAGRSA